MDGVLQVQETRTVLRSVQQVAGPGAMDMLAVPRGIVETRSGAYDPARGRGQSRLVPTIETPEKARLREDLERTKAALQAAQAQAAQATVAERHKVEQLENVAFHDQ